MSYMKKTRILSLVLFSIALSGCGEEIKTVDWWRNHPEEAISKVEECKKSGDVSDNCKKRQDCVVQESATRCACASN